MSVADVSTLLKELQSNVDELRDLLKPLLGGVGEVSAKLPLLDQAKLNVLTCYAIESLLFNAMRLNGVEVQNHSIYTELKRVRQYFDKIKAIENPPAPREGTVNIVPAMRILRNDLGDNKEIKSQLTQLIAEEKDKASKKASKKRPAEGSEDIRRSQGETKQGKRAKRRSSKEKK